MATETGEQLQLIDVGPKNSKKLNALAKGYKAIIAERLALQAKEADKKAKIMQLLHDEHLSRLEDGSMKCRCEGFEFSLTPKDEVLKVTESDE